MNEPIPYYRQRLREELSRRIEQNPKYSLRAFAKALAVEPSTLSQILLGKRFLSEKMIDRLLKKIELSPEEQSQFVRSIALARKASGLIRTSRGLREAISQRPIPTSTKPTKDLTLDHFRVVSDWYHTAIIEMTGTADFKADPRTIARRLGISTIEAKNALERLLELELLEYRDGELVKTKERVNTLDKSKTSVWHRKRQKQVLEKSLESLENDPIEKRVHASVTFGIDPDKVNSARERIQKFIWEMTEFMTQDNRKTVYEMTVNLFPLEKGE